MPSVLTGVVACAAAVSVAAAPVPMYLWSSTARQPSGSPSSENTDGARFTKYIREAAGQANTIIVYTVDNLHAEDVAPLTVAAARKGTATGMTLLAQSLGRSQFSLSIKSADLTAADVTGFATQFSDRCKLVTVAGVKDTGSATMSRKEFEAAIVSKAESCTVYQVPLTREQLDSEITFAVSTSAAATKAGPSLAVLTAQPETSWARKLQASSNPRPGRNTTNIFMTPPIMEGLLVSLLLIFFLALGVYCVMGIQSPDQLFNTGDALPAGKEF